MELQVSSKDRTKSTGRLSEARAVLGTLLIAVGLGGCLGTGRQELAVHSACDVFTDSLRDVHATTPAGEDRISKHFESGIEAKCWSR